MNEKRPVAVVIGASRGIGAYIAQGLASDGFVVVAAGRTFETKTTTKSKQFESPNSLLSLLSSLSSVCNLINESGCLGAAVPIECDVSSDESIAALFETVKNKLRLQISVVVYNAGAIFWGPVVNTTAKRFNLMNRVNTCGLYKTVDVVLPLFIKAKMGRFLVVSPPIYSRFFRGKTPYAMGKVGMTVLTHGLGMELADLNKGYSNQNEGIAITSLWPATAIQSAVTEVKNVPLNYLRHPSIFADAVVGILKEPASKVNGLALLDEDYLRAYRGVSDFSKYRLIPDIEPPRMMPKAFPSLLVEEQEDRAHVSSAMDPLQDCKALLSVGRSKTIGLKLVQCLNPNEYLKACQYLQVVGYYTIMQPDGNLVIYKGLPGNTSSPIWTTGIQKPNYSQPAFRFNSLGSIRIEDSKTNSTISAAKTAPISLVCLHPTGKVNAYDSFPYIRWSNPSTPGFQQCLIPGDSLYTGQILRVSSYYASMQANANLLIYQNISKPTWSTGLKGIPSGNYSFSFQKNFVLAVLGTSGQPLDAAIVPPSAKTTCLYSDGRMHAYDEDGFDIWVSPSSNGLSLPGCGLRGVTDANNQSWSFVIAADVVMKETSFALEGYRTQYPPTGDTWISLLVNSNSSMSFYSSSGVSTAIGSGNATSTRICLQDSGDLIFYQSREPKECALVDQRKTTAPENGVVRICIAPGTILSFCKIMKNAFTIPNFDFSMKLDGNMHFYAFGKSVWNTGLPPSLTGIDNTFVFGLDGSFEIRNKSGSVLVSTPSLSGIPTSLCLTKFGDLILGNDTSIMWAPPPGRGVLSEFGNNCRLIGEWKHILGGGGFVSSCMSAFDVLRPCQFIRNNGYVLEMKDNGILTVTYQDYASGKPSKVIWTSRSSPLEQSNYSFMFNSSALSVFNSHNTLVDGFQLPNNLLLATDFCLHSNGGVGLFSNHTQLWSRPERIGFEITSSNDQCASKRNVGQMRVHNGTLLNCLLPGDFMKPCEYLQTGDTMLLFRGDANLVLQNVTTNTQLWSAGISAQNWGSNYQFAVQSDGNMVVYDGGLSMLASWRYSPVKQSISDLCVRPDGVVALYDGMDVVWMNPAEKGLSQCGPVGAYQNINGNERTCLKPNERLGSCQYLKAGKFYAIMQTDGILSVKSSNPFSLSLLGHALYPYIPSAGPVHWNSSSTSFEPSCGLFNHSCAGNFGFQFSANGDFLISRTLDSLFVTSYSLPPTSQLPADQLCIQDDGDFVLYSGNKTLWAYPTTPGFAGGDQCGPIGYNPGIRGDMTCLTPTDSLNVCRYVRSGNFYVTAHPLSFGSIALYNGTRGIANQLSWESDVPASVSATPLFLPLNFHCFKGFNDAVVGTDGTPLSLRRFFSDTPKMETGARLWHRGFIDFTVYRITSDLGSRVSQTLPKNEGAFLRDANKSIYPYPRNYYRNGTYYLVLNGCSLMYIQNTGWSPSPTSSPKNTEDLLKNHTLLWISNYPILYPICYFYLDSFGAITLSTYEQSFEPVDKVITSGDMFSFTYGGANLYLEAGRLVVRDNQNRTIWNSLDAPRVNKTTTFGFRQNSSSCGLVGYYKAIGSSVATCIQPGQSLKACEYMRIGNYYLNVTEYSTLELYQGKPVDRKALQLWKSGERQAANNQTSFLYSLDKNLVVGDGTINMTKSGDFTIGAGSQEFCLVDTGIFGLYQNNSLVWSTPNRDGFSGFNDIICWRDRTVLPIGHHHTNNGRHLTCMKRGDSIQPCQKMIAGNFTLRLQMTFTDYPRVLDTEGNLILEDSTSKVLWEIGARRIPRKQVTLTFDETGDIVVSDGSNVVSAIGNTIGKDSTDFCVQSDGRVVMYNVVGDKWNEVWSNPGSLVGFSGFGGDRCGLVGHKQTVNGQDASCMDPGDSFRTCQYMQVGSYFFTLNANSTLLVYNGTRNRINDILWSSQLAFNSEEGPRFTFGLDKTLAITKAIASNPFIPIVDTTLSKKGEKLCLLSNGTLSLFDNKNTPIWTAGAAERGPTPLSNIYDGPQCGPRGHWRHPVDGVKRICLLPGESLRTCQWLNLDDLYFTWAARSSSPNKIELMIYRGSRYAKTDVFWSSGMDTPGSFNSLMYLDYNLDGNLVLTANGTAVVGVSNRLTDTQGSSYLCLMSDAAVKLFDVEDSVIWKNPGNSTGFSGSGAPCS
ncbi:UNVERIFIED_CONTAM: hypothetical protein HDU68_010002 [Siphonaria sp. JEL0065]|nr:hypothetical protein HDU68_010002 [Siphonaria sp. JEL0065]